jgi:hypothetical protein
MMSSNLVQALAEAKARELYCGGAPCCAEWRRSEHRGK